MEERKFWDSIFQISFENEFAMIVRYIYGELLTHANLNGDTYLC